MSSIAESILSSISDKTVVSLVKTQLAIDPSLASKALRKKYLFDEAIAFAEHFEIQQEYRRPVISDYQRLLWQDPNSNLEDELLNSPIIYEIDLEAGISKPKLLRSANGAWFIWKHEGESDWAINNSAEVATSIIDRHLDLQVVPYTFSYDLNSRKGIRQLWLHGTEMVFLNFPKSVDPISSSKIRLLDYLIFNRDRRSTNMLVDRSSKGRKRLYGVDHGGAFYKRQLKDGSFEKRPPQEVLSFVGAHSTQELFPSEDIKNKFASLDPANPFPGLEKHLADFDLSGISERVGWLQRNL